ncbi:hypothetical protein CSA08_03365 [Candidatus Gracilibacteria bacterium]|nr:MAG: hypothetical protein CSA08_03365 [Candidatus Gracilibacteria bacterium]
MNRINFYFVVFLSLVWFLLSYLYISLDIYDLSELSKGEYKILTYREQFLEYCLLVGMFLLGIYLGRTIISSDTYKITNKSKYSTKDNLTKIKGVNSEIERVLNGKGIKTYKDISNLNEFEIKELLDESNIVKTNLYIETWSEQAKLAYLGKWKQLKEYKYFIIEERNV